MVDVIIMYTVSTGERSRAVVSSPLLTRYRSNYLVCLHCPPQPQILTVTPQYLQCPQRHLRK